MTELLIVELRVQGEKGTMINLEEMTFEKAMSELENIVHKLENGDAALDDAINLYKDGLELSKWCNAKLKQAEEQITTIMTTEGEKPFSIEGEV